MLRAEWEAPGNPMVVVGWGPPPTPQRTIPIFPGHQLSRKFHLWQWRSSLGQCHRGRGTPSPHQAFVFIPANVGDEVQFELQNSDKGTVAVKVERVGQTFKCPSVPVHTNANPSTCPTNTRTTACARNKTLHMSHPCGKKTSQSSILISFYPLLFAGTCNGTNFFLHCNVNPPK